MSYEWFLARRYLQSRRGRTAVSVITAISTAGVALGVASLIIALSIVQGFSREIRSKIIGFGSHIQVAHYNPDEPIVEARALESALLRIDGIERMSPFIARQGLIHAGGNAVEGVQIKGIAPETDVSFLRRELHDGRFAFEADTSGRPGVVIGRTLADELGLSVGSDVTLFAYRGGGSPSTLSPPAIEPARIAGIYASGMAEFDGSQIYVDLPTARTLFGFGPSAVSGFELMLTDLNRADQVASAIDSTLGYPYRPITIFEQYHNLFSWVELQQSLIPIVLVLIVLVATFNLIGMLLMVVLEKTREVGILKAMGASRGGIARVFLAEGMVIGLVGTALGNGLALALCELQLRYRLLPLPADIYYMDRVPILIAPMNFIVVSLVTLGLCALATLVPSLVAGRIQPVRAIRFA